jgi:anthranilate synthase component 1
MPTTLQLPSYSDFQRLARTHTLVPVYRTLTADLETPVSAFLRVAAAEPQAFLLESVEGGEKVGRYTFIGIRPYKTLTARGDRITLSETGAKPQQFTGDIFTELKKHLSGHKPAILPQLPPFTAGAVGFFAYDAVRLIERLPSLAIEEISVPDACLMFFDEVLAFDHVKKEIHLIVTADLTRSKAPVAYASAVRRLARLESKLAGPLPKTTRAKTKLGKLKINSRTPKMAFLKAVEKTREYIAAGDIFQCVLSQRFDVVPGVDPFAIYRALRIVNPSPYMYFLRFEIENEDAQKKSSRKSAKSSALREAAHIVGSSPEMLVRVHGRQVEYRPIAGTRPRSLDDAVDRQHEQDLRADPKEVAEHVMLVDLGRNDVGRVSEYGSVHVKDLMTVERYSHVMHLVSSLEGRLRPKLTPVDAFRACFPAGTLSGAPKIRAMEIIEELEPARRGVYGGCILYADFNGNLDSCIAIRTLYMHGEQGHVQAGAGIVADSVPETEFVECMNKTQAVMRAIERARG